MDRLHIHWMLTEEEERKGGIEVTNKTTTNITADNHTLYVQWTANNYTVTLNVNGGDALPVNEFIVTYDQPYNCLPSASRTGHTFIGWFTEENGGTEVTNKTTANITAVTTHCMHTGLSTTTSSHLILRMELLSTKSMSTMKQSSTQRIPPKKNVFSMDGCLNQRQCLQMTLQL